MVKRVLCVILTLLFVIGIFAACGTKSPAENGGAADTAPAEQKLSIVTTIFPLYDWTRELLGDAADQCDLTMLMDSGVDLHNYQPSAEDILKISSCNLFLYVGGESDKWVTDVLAQATNKDMEVIDLLETMGDRVKMEEEKEGMEHHHDDDAHEEIDTEEAGHEDAHDHEGEEPEYDEHVWLSLKNAVFLCDEIAARLQKLLPEQTDAINKNRETYTARLQSLDGEYQAAANAAAVKTVLFGDRFPFRYMVDDYGLDYYAAFSGCSAETEASFSTISTLAAKVDELGLHAVLQIETADGSIAKTIIQNTQTKDQKILTMNSLQSVTSKDVGTGVTYYTVMQSNLEVLKQALK